MDRKELAKQIGLNIRKIRLKRDLSQETVALSAEIHPAYFGRLERGEKCPTIDTLYKVAKALDVSLYEVIDCQEAPKVTKSNALFRIEQSLKELPEKEQDSIAELVESIIRLSKNLNLADKKD
jgi:transcriptional regulator with XRE-family HTH domain